MRHIPTLCIALCLCLSAAHAAAKTYHLSTSGNDSSGPGRTPDASIALVRILAIRERRTIQ